MKNKITLQNNPTKTIDRLLRCLINDKYNVELIMLIVEELKEEIGDATDYLDTDENEENEEIQKLIDFFNRVFDGLADGYTEAEDGLIDLRALTDRMFLFKHQFENLQK